MNNVCRAIDLVITYLEDYSRESDPHIKDLAWGSAMGLLQGLKIMTEEKQNEEILLRQVWNGNDRKGI